VLVLVRDVSEQRRLLRRVTAAENLASLGTLAACLAHEINNPLTYVVTGDSAIRASLAAGERIEAAEVDSVLDGCWRVRDIVRTSSTPPRAARTASRRWPSPRRSTPPSRWSGRR
jgi:signal transduction histidine kinase